MKQAIITLISFATICLFSCGKTNCLTPGVGFVFVNNGDTIPDVSAYILKYQKGSSRSNLVDSFADLPLAIHSSATDGKYLDIPETGNTVFYGYDWKIVLLPSGKTYLITNAGHSNKTQGNTGLGGIKDHCVNSVDYTVNGVNYNSGVSQTISSSATATLSIHYN